MLRKLDFENNWIFGIKNINLTYRALSHKNIN